MNPSVGCTGCWLPGAGSCLAEHPQAAMQVGQCHLLLGPPPWQAHPAQLSSQAAWDSVSGLAGRLSLSINTTLAARAGSEAG